MCQAEEFGFYYDALVIKFLNSVFQEDNSCQHDVWIAGIRLIKKAIAVVQTRDSGA